MRCSKPTITDLEKKYVNDAVSKNDIGIGEYLEKFENAWANKNLRKYGVACNSGTNAIFLALKALGIKEGDEVIVPEFTMVATAWAVTYTGANPIFVDCKDDLNIDYDKIKPSDKAKAIIATPIYGRKIDSRVYELGIPVIEDMAEAHGIPPRGIISCYSFYGNKIVATGEGGMCLTDRQDLADEMRSLANMYFDKNRTLLHPKVGYNFRMTNIHAAIGLAQVERFDEIFKKRKQIEEWYDKYLIPEVLMPKRDTVWMYDINCGDKQAEVKRYLDSFGIESRYFFKPMSMQPMYDRSYKHLNAYRWSKQGLYLPTYFDMTEKDVEYVSGIVNAVMRK